MTDRTAVCACNGHSDMAASERKCARNHSSGGACPTPGTAQPATVGPAASPLDEIVRELVGVLEEFLAVVDESRGVIGFHLNGAIAEWDEFSLVAMAHAALAKAKGGA